METLPESNFFPGKNHISFLPKEIGLLEANRTATPFRMVGLRAHRPSVSHVQKDVVTFFEVSPTDSTAQVLL